MEAILGGKFDTRGKPGIGAGNVRNLEARKAAGETLSPAEEDALKKLKAMQESQRSK